MADIQPKARRPLWDYLFYDKKLPEKPEVLHIAEAVQQDRFFVVGVLMNFWAWVDNQFPDGSLRSISVRNLFAICPHMTERFVTAMCEIGWLVQEDDGLRIPHAERWFGVTAKRRFQERLRIWNKRHNTNQCSHLVAEVFADDNENVRLAGRQDSDSDSDSDSDVLNHSASPLEPEKTPKPPRAKKEKPPPVPRPRNLLFDALAEVTASDPEVSGSHIGKVVSKLNKAIPPYTAEEVRCFAATAGKHFPWLKGQLTLGVVEKYIGVVRAPEASHNDLFSGLREFLNGGQSGQP